MSGKSESLSVWLGECSNYVGSIATFHRNDSNWRVSDRNRDESTPRCLMMDLAQNVGTSHALGREDYGHYFAAEATAAATRTSNSIFDEDNWNGKVEKYVNAATIAAENDAINYWCDLISSKTKFHSKSLCPLPLWVTKDNFHMYHSALDVISNSLYEETVDKIRYLAEECDRLASLSVTCDVYNGFSGFTTKLLQEIREDLPTVTIPVWTINNSPLVDVFSGTTNNEQSKLISDLNIPLTYAHMAEYANVIIPMDPTNILRAGDDNRMITTALTMASAIDTYSSYQYISGSDSAKRLSSVHEWCHSLTYNGRFKLAMTEVCYPFAESVVTDSNVWNVSNMAKEKCCLTPFTISLFPTLKINPWVSDREKICRQYSNLISVRCDTFASKSISDAIQANYETHSKLLTNIFCANSNVILPPKIQDKLGFDESSVPMLAAIGSNDYVFEHVREQTELWRSSYRSCKVQLSKVGINQDEHEEIADKLINLSDI